MTEQEQAHEIIHWIKDDLKCIYMVSEIKRELKDISKDRYEFWNRVHKIIYEHFKNSN
jgi:hypothetical protein